MGNIYLPFVARGGKVFQPHPETVEFSHLLTGELQLRKDLFPDERLFQAAHYKVRDMVDRDYFSHTDPDGFGPNYIVRELFQFPLPKFYSEEPDGNQIESISSGHPTAAISWSALLSSPGHRRHLLGEGFFSDQNCYGIGFAAERGLWCVLIAELGSTPQTSGE